MSLFNKIYKYRQSDLRHQKENFLTEIFSYCLTNDLIFRQNFLSLINYNENVVKFHCVTQLPNNDFGKPDVFIEINENTIIIIECKVGSTQEETQLKRYSKILLKHKSESKYLIFLTKIFEETEIFELPINFFPIKWYEVSELLIDCKNEVSKELNNYLKEEKMSTKISFNKNELSAIKDIQETTAKMSEFISLVKICLDKYVKSKMTLSKKIENSSYGITTDFHNGKLWLGFCQYEENDEMQICISVDEVPYSNMNFKELDSKLKSFDWKSYDNDNKDKRTWYKGSNFSSFFIQDSFAANKALSFLEVEIQNIKQFL
jgi:hypothetical protein